MRKFYSGILLALFSFLSVQTVKAQINAYTFSQSSGTYTAITGGTVHASTTTGWDDDLYTGNIGFNFKFNGAEYTTVNINSNGYITFGATAPSTTNYSPISSTAGYSGAVAALARDLIANTANNSEIRSETIGSAPNRTYVVQWTNARRYSGGPISGDDLDFQIRLHETTNVIDIVYGTFTITSTSLGSQVGLRGATDAAYHNRTTTTDWSASTAGGSNTASMTTSPTITPASGLTFIWTPPALPPIDLSLVSITGMPAAPCPAAAVPISATIRNMGANTLDFSATNATVTVEITGASTQTVTVTLNSGTLAPDASMTVPLFPVANLSTGGTHNFAGTVTITGDAIAANNTASASTTIVFTSTLPAATDFTGFTGSNLTTVFPGWREGDGATQPLGTTSSWVSTTGVGGASNVTAKVNLFTTTGTEWIVSPRFPVTANTVLQYDVAVTEFATTSTPSDMGSDDRVSVLVSTDCGNTWTEVKAYTVADNLTTTLTPQLVNLSAYAGQNIMVAFKATDGPVNDIEDYDFHVDNILIADACSGPPTPGTLNAPASVCASTSFTITVDGATGAAGLTYQWESSTDGVSWTPIAGAVSADLTTTQSAATFYRRHIYCGAATDVTPPLVINMNVAFDCHCIPPPTDCTLGDVIENVTLGTLNNSTTCSANGYGTFFTAVPVPNMQRTSSYPISVTVGDGGTEHVAVWVDFDQSGSYDPSEFILLGSGNGSTVNGFVTVPITAALGNTKMRVRVRWNTALTANNACLGYSFGETEDYIVNITAAPACVAPSTVAVSGMTNTSASISFSSGGSNFILEYGAPGFTPGTGATAGTGGTVITGTASPIAIPGLTANTSYDVYVRQDCGSGNISANSILLTITTLCDPTNVPYVENFDGVTTPAIPTCTTREDLNAGTTWTTIGAPAGYTGFTLQYGWNGSLPGDDWFYTRGLNLTGGTVYRLVFKYGNNSTFFEENLSVHYGTGANATSMTNLLADHPGIVDGVPHMDTIMFTPATTGVYYIGFHSYSDADMFNLYVDDISVVKAPLVDVSPIALITPPVTCPVNLATIQATIKNLSIYPLDLSVNPVTVTATITGAGTGSLTTIANTGTIAPGATLDVTLSPTFNFTVGGNYNFEVTTTQALDEVTTNDSYSTVVFVNTPPTLPTITPATPTVCLGTTGLLTASGSMASTTGTITGTSPTTSTDAQNAFFRLWEGSRKQYMIRATELTALGLVSGSNLNSVSFNVTAIAGSPDELLNFNIKAGLTSATDLATSFATGTTMVFSSPSYDPVAGANTFNFSTPLAWDGTSNVIIEVCFDNDPDNSCDLGTPACWGNTPTMSVATAGFTATREVHDDNTGGTREMCTMTSTSNTTVVSTLRPVMVLGYTAPSSYTWSPAATIFTDAAGTVAYTGGAANSVYVMPSAPTTYTVTATSAVGCVTSTTVNVGITPITEIVTQPAAAVSACVGGPVTLTVGAAGAGLSYQWQKGGADIAGATSSSYTINNLAYGDAGTYTVVVTGTCAPSVTSANSVLTVTDNSWVGTSNSDWNNSANWCGGVPTQTMSVIIPQGTPFAPVIQGNAPVNNITINTGATVEITSSGRLILQGNITNNGTFNSTSGSVEFVGTANQTVPALTAAYVYVNGAGITLGGDMNVGTALTLTNGNITLGNNNLVMTGGTAGSVASHIVTNGTGTVTNNNVGTVSVIFPVGPTADSYNPVTIANGQGRNYTVGVVTGLPAAPSLANSARMINRTWNVTVNTAPTSPVNVNLQFADADANPSATPTANMQVGVSNGTTWLIPTPAAGVPTTGSAAARTAGFQTQSFGPMVVGNIGGVTFPTAASNVDADVTSVVLMPNIVDNMAVLRVKTRRTTAVEWSVIDGSGRVVMTFRKQVLAGQNDIQLSLGKLASGSYQLIGSTEKGRVETVRFVRL